MKIIVATGGRYYANNGFVHDFLNDHKPHMVVHGGATGADSLVDGWASIYSVPRVIFGLSRLGDNGWAALGLRAGHVRNQAMIDFLLKMRGQDMFGNPLWVTQFVEIFGVAFPGANGTNDMCKRMRASGLIFHDFRQSSLALSAGAWNYGKDL